MQSPEARVHELAEMFRLMGDANRLRILLLVLEQPRAVGEIAAATHPRDGTTRPQEVHASWNPEYHKIIEKVGEATGSPVVLNTSFNLHGYPIVRSPGDAIDVFDRSGLKHLALGNFMVTKKQA